MKRMAMVMAMGAILVGCGRKKARMIQVGYSYHTTLTLLDSQTKKPIAGATVVMRDDRSEHRSVSDQQGVVRVARTLSATIPEDLPPKLRRAGLPNYIDFVIQAPGYKKERRRFGIVEYIHKGVTPDGAIRYRLEAIVRLAPMNLKPKYKP